jgi:hypothetical protein
LAGGEAAGTAGTRWRARPPIDLDRPAGRRIVRAATDAAHAALRRCAASAADQLRVRKVASGELAKAKHKKKGGGGGSGDDENNDDDEDLSDLEDFGFDLSALGDLGDGDFADVVEEAATDAAAEQLNALGIEGDEYGEIIERVSARAVAAAREQSAQLVSGVDESTQGMLRDVIAGGLEDNVGLDGIIERIEGSAAFGEQRAGLIARTEVRDSNERGALEGLRGARAAGVNTKKSWLLGPDPCEICQDNADASPIDLDDDFPSGDSEPTAHPNCECSIIGVVGEDDVQEVAGVSGLRKAGEGRNRHFMVTQYEAGYLDTSPHDDATCAGCTNFRPAADGRFLGNCSLVSGTISPRGWCRYWEAK